MATAEAFEYDPLVRTRPPVVGVLADSLRAAPQDFLDFVSRIAPFSVATVLGLRVLLGPM